MMSSVRTGTVLHAGSILKIDSHASTVAQKDSGVVLSGAQNFRVVAGPNGQQVCASAQPTLVGVRSVCNSLSDTPVLWINLREEPLVYINSRPVLLREAATPFANVAYHGIGAERLDELEERLKADILAEARRGNGNVLLHAELQAGELSECWEAVVDDVEDGGDDGRSVQTPREVIATLARRRALTFLRVPITPETAPEAPFFDQILRAVHAGAAQSSGATVVQCHQGRGRSTTGSVVVLMTAHALAGSLALLGDAAAQQHRADRQDPDGMDALRNGDYWPILALCRSLENGTTAKAIVDGGVDSCAQVQNLRLVIFQSRMAAEQAQDTSSAQRCTERATVYLQRYFMLIAYAAYLIQAVEPTKGADAPAMTFAAWFEGRREFAALLGDIAASGLGALAAPAPTGGETAATAVGQVARRSGNVLGRHMILKGDQVVRTNSAADVLSSTTSLREVVRKTMHGDLLAIDGAMNPRHVIDSVHAVGSATVDGVRGVIDTARTHRAKQCTSETVVWINLREEPVVYVRDVPYVLRSEAQPYRNVADFRGMDVARIEALDARLKADVVAEIEASNGSLLLHGEHENRRLDPFVLEGLTAADVQTTSEVFARVHAAGHAVELVRVPISPEAIPEPDVVDVLVRTICGVVGKQPIVLSDHQGRGRATLASVVAIILATHLGVARVEPATAVAKAGHQVGSPVSKNAINHLRSSAMALLSHTTGLTADDHLNIGSLGSAVFERESMRRSLGFPVVLAIQRLLARPHAVRELVDDSIAMASTVLHLTRTLARFVEQRRSDERDVAAEQMLRAHGLLDRYLLLLCFGAYVLETPVGEMTPEPSSTFAKWMADRPEVSRELAEFRAHPDAPAWSIVDTVVKPGAPGAQGVLPAPATCVATRSGTVLSAGHGVKSDHFPNCQRMHLRPLLTGAPNFRQTPGARVYGCAMPTTTGIKSVLDHLDAMQAANRVVWLNMREEPVLFINSRPFVLRDMGKPFGNIEHTGITSERVASMEERLKRDVLAEALRYDGRFLVHDEDDTGLVEVWESVDGESVRTTAEEYEHLVQKGYHVDFHRLPVTDEQAPKVSDFDAIVAIAPRDPTVHAITQCQMGRGRTTTALVVICLWQHVGGHAADGLVEQITRRLAEAAATAPPTSPEGESRDRWFLHGNYASVLSLVRLLPTGGEAKALLDVVLDLCSAMQNLREAIYDYKVKVDVVGSRDANPSSSNFRRGIGYLHRYLLLIAFTAHLLQAKGASVEAGTFEAFMAARPELGNLIEATTTMD